MTDSNSIKPGKRRYRVYAFDPAASVNLETAVINDALIELPWEKRWEDPLGVGPSNEYLEVLDYDQFSRTFYEPLDPNHPWLLAQDGLAPSEGNPQFHQQMVFAVAMNTIRNFERALGRLVFWSIPDDDERVTDKGKRKGSGSYPQFVRQLRIYPHALREANAYFSPGKGALLFGYFKSKPRSEGDEGQWIYTCLSQDIIAHETTHAILHGMRRRGIEPVNEDSLAFHEGFADIVALLQHFTMRRVVCHELARTGGELRSESLLNGLASQLGAATGRGGALRMALETLQVERHAEEHGRTPHIKTLAEVSEPHDRGQCLVAAVFDTLVTIYERRTSDLFLLAGVPRGSSNLPEKLVARLAEEAGKTAQAVLAMCVRGLDYLPPAASTFGDYLRAVITADTELVPEDALNFRVALAESFRKRGVPIPGCVSYAPDALCWDQPDLRKFKAIADRTVGEEFTEPDALFAGALRKLIIVARLTESKGEREGSEAEARQEDERYSADPRWPRANDRGELIETSPYLGDDTANRNLRDEAMRVVEHNRLQIYRWLLRPMRTTQQQRMWESLLGICILPLGLHLDAENRKSEAWSPLSIKAHRIPQDRWARIRKPDDWRDDQTTTVEGMILLPKFEVHSVRIARRIGPDGRELAQMIAQITQKRRGYFDPERQKQADLTGKWEEGDEGEPDFWFRGGATIIVDLRDGKLEQIVRQRIDKDDRLERQRKFLNTDALALSMAKSSRRGLDAPVFGFEREPFAFMHGDM